MAEKKVRNRSAKSGKIVSKAEAEAKPNETVKESTAKDGLGARLALIERVIEEGGGPLAILYRRRKAGFTD